MSKLDSNPNSNKMKMSEASVKTLLVLALFWVGVQTEKRLDPGGLKSSIVVMMVAVGVWYLQFMVRIYFAKKNQ